MVKRPPKIKCETAISCAIEQRSEHKYSQTEQKKMNEAIAERMRSKRVKDKTKGNYSGKLNTIKVFLLTNNFAVHIGERNEIIVPLPDAVLKQLFGWLSVNTDLPKKSRRKKAVAAAVAAALADLDSDSESDSDDDVPAQPVDIFAERIATISASCMQGYKSALGWFYTEKYVIMEASIEQWIAAFIQGYKRTVAEKKAAGVMDIKEGKSKLAFNGYVEIAKHLMKKAPVGRKGTWAQGIYGWAFMTISWNLMARGDSVRNIMLQHVNWKNDCMTITFALHKGDATGEGLGNEKHVYANTYNPQICPILAMSLLVFTCHRGGNVVEQGLFAGCNSDGRFGKMLAAVIAELPQNILGAAPEDIGTHSSRKGSTSYCLEFVVISAVQVYLRAGWSLGDVPDRYIFAGAGGDQIVGRAVCGLPINSKEFGVLPPHFSAEDIALLNDIGWQHILEGYSNYPVVPYLLASLLYHEEYLRLELSARHPIWNQKLFTTLLPGKSYSVADFCRGKILTGLGTCKSSSMRATGVPPHLDIVLEVDELRKAVVALQESVKADKLEVIASIEAIPELVKSCIMANFSIDGVVAITAADLQSR